MHAQILPGSIQGPHRQVFFPPRHPEPHFHLLLCPSSITQYTRHYVFRWVLGPLLTLVCRQRFCVITAAAWRWEQGAWSPRNMIEGKECRWQKRFSDGSVNSISHSASAAGVSWRWMSQGAAGRKSGCSCHLGTIPVQIHHSGQTLLQLLWLQRESEGLAAFASISDAIVSSRSLSHCLGSSSKKSHLTMGWGGWGSSLVRAEGAQTRTILWNALRLGLSSSHFSHPLLFLSLETAGPSRKVAPCWEVMSVFMPGLVQKHLEEMGKCHALAKTQSGWQ